MKKKDKVDTYDCWRYFRFVRMKKKGQGAIVAT